MAVYIITYDLKGETDGQAYQKLISLIKEEQVWACLGESSYLICSNQTAVDLRDKFSSVLKPSDLLYVGVVNAPAAWHGFSKEVSNWIKEKL